MKTMTKTRSANRTDTDRVALALLDLSPGVWHDVAAVQEALAAELSPYRVTAALRYVSHCYGGVHLSAISESFVMWTDLEPYLESRRTPCGCGRCSGEGEHER